MEGIVEKWFAILFVILTTVNKLFSYTHLFKNIYKHIAWYLKGEIIVIVCVHGHIKDSRIIGPWLRLANKSTFVCSAMTPMICASGAQGIATELNLNLNYWV